MNQHLFYGTAKEIKWKGQQILRTFHVNSSYSKENRYDSDECIKRDENIIVFFDIDDTLLNTKKSMTPIQPIVDLHHACKSLGLKIVIITARPSTSENRKYTENQLFYYGIDYDLLYMSPYLSYANVPESAIYEYKRNCREDALQRLNGIPLFSVGDKEWDVGQYGGIGLIIA